MTPTVRWRLGAPGRDGLPGLAAAGSWLCAAERARLGRLTVEKRRHDWLAGRLNAKALLAGLIEARVGRASVPSALEIARHPSGAPFARVAAEAAPFSGFGPGEVLPVALSNSHSHGHAFCAAVWIDEGWTPSPVPAGHVGTLVETGRGQRAPDTMPALLAGGQRALAGATAPAHGLVLKHVWYDDDSSVP